MSLSGWALFSFGPKANLVWMGSEGTEGMEGNGHMSTSTEDMQQQVQDLRKDQEVQAATQAGAQATQAATQAGQASTMAATQAGTWSTMAAGWVGMVVGMFLGLAIASSRR